MLQIFVELFILFIFIYVFLREVDNLQRVLQEKSTIQFLY